MFENSNTGGALLQREFIFLLQRQTSSATNDPENNLVIFLNMFNNKLIGSYDQKSLNFILYLLLYTAFMRHIISEKSEDYFTLHPLNTIHAASSAW